MDVSWTHNINKTIINLQNLVVRVILCLERSSLPPYMYSKTSSTEPGGAESSILAIFNVIFTEQNSQ